MNITTFVNDKSIETTTKITNEAIQCNQKSIFTIIKLPVNKVNSRFTEVFSEKNDDKNPWNIDIVYDKKIKPICEALETIQDSSKYLYFIEQYKQDFKRIHEKLKPFINITSVFCIDNNKNPIAVATSAATLKDHDMQNLIQSFKLQFDYAKLYFDNPYALKFIEKNYAKQRDIIKLVKAIGFYSVLHDNTDKSLVFCQQLSHFIRTKRGLISIPDIINIIANLDKYIKSSIIKNETAKLTKNCSKLNNDKKDTNDLNNDSFKHVVKQHIDIPKPQQIKAIIQPNAIKDSDNDSAFIERYKQDLKQIYNKLKELISIASSIHQDDQKNPIIIAKLAITLKNSEIQNLIQSFQSQVNYTELYFNNSQAIQIIEEKYKNLGDIIKLVRAIGFYAVLYKKTDKALYFCKKLSEFIREKRELTSIPKIINTIYNMK